MTHAAARTSGMFRRMGRPFAFVWSSWRGLTASEVRNALLMATALATGWGAAWAVLQYRATWWRLFLSQFGDTLIPAVVLLLCIAVATRVRTKRLPGWVPFAIAATVASFLAWLIGNFIVAQLILYFAEDSAQWPGMTTPFWIGTWLNWPPIALFCLLAALAYRHARDARWRADALREVQLRRAKVRRATYEAQLQAMQARVEPQFLFDTLKEIEKLYASNPTRARRMLDDLIVYLRAALPSLRESASTLSIELRLTRAWLDIVKFRFGDRLVADIAVAEEALQARMPPMVLLPLVEHALEAGMRASSASKAIAIAGSVVQGRLRLAISEAGSAFTSDENNATAAEIRDRLKAVYGDQAFLAFRVTEPVGTQAILEIPYEQANGDHR